MIDEPKPKATVDIIWAKVYFDWSMKGLGFGQLSFSYNKDTGELTCMNECMDRETVRTLLHALADHVADNCRLMDDCNGDAQGTSTDETK